MRVVLDTTVLLQLVDTSAPPPPPPEGISIKDARPRLEYLVQSLTQAAAEAIIPTPALAEVLVRASPAVQAVLTGLSAAKMKIVPFDTLAAVECAALLRRALSAKEMKNRRKSRAATKFDRQIVAIAKVQGAEVIYSDDADIKRLGRAVGIQVLGTWDLPTPPIPPQGQLELDRPDS